MCENLANKQSLQMVQDHLPVSAGNTENSLSNFIHLHEKTKNRIITFDDFWMSNVLSKYSTFASHYTYTQLMIIILVPNCCYQEVRIKARLLGLKVNVYPSL